MLPTPIADSIALTVSGTFIGYQGFMSLALVNPLGYGSDKIFDPKDNIPYTYRVNQHYDSAQFMAYLENPRFERSIEIASQSLPHILSDSLSASLREAIPRAYALNTAYALDSSWVDLSVRYPYAAGDRLGIFLSKGSRQPLQNGVTGTGSRDISLSDISTLDIIVGSQWDDEYVSTDISTGSLSSLRDGSFDDDALLALNTGSGSSSWSGDNNGWNDDGGSLSGYVLTMGSYTLQGQPMYGYVWPGFLNWPYASYITTIQAGDLTPKTLNGKTIDSILFYQGQQILLLENGSGIPNVVVSEGSQSSDCIADDPIGSVQLFGCESVSIVGPYTPGEMRVLGMDAWVVPPPPPPWCPLNPTDESYFTFDSNNGTITGYATNGPKAVTIPSTIGGMSVVSIGADAFMSKWLTCVDLPNSVVSIWYGAFSSNQLTSVVIGNGVASIGDYTFSDNQLTSVVIPDGVVSIGLWAFASNQLTSVVIPDSVTSIGTYTFYDNRLTSVVIGNGVTSIGDYTFSGNQLTSVVIPDGVTSIWYDAFSDNQLTSAVIPNSVTSIGDRAFAYNQLTSMVIPDGVTSIGNNTFSQNQLTSMVIPDGVTSIGNNTFSQNQLTSVVIGNGVTSIGDWTFVQNQLTSVVIPDGVTSIGNYAFFMNQLTSVVIPDGVTSIWYEAFTSNQLTSVVIGDSVTSIGYSAFSGNQLTSVVIPDSVTNIGYSAFSINQLTSVVIGNGVTSIGNYAFAYNQLTSVVIGNSVTSIGDYTFTLNQLTSVIIPASVTNIGYRAFSDNHIPSAGDITVYCDIPTFWSQVFDYNGANTDVNIPNPTTCIP